MKKFFHLLIVLFLFPVSPLRAQDNFDYFQIKGEFQKRINEIEARMKRPGLKPAVRKNLLSRKKYLKAKLQDYTLIEKWKPLAERYVKQKKYDKAIDAYTNLIEGSETERKANLIARADCYRLSGKTNQAIKDYESYLYDKDRFANKISSIVQMIYMLDQETSVRKLAELYEKNSQKDKVIELYSNEIAIRPDDLHAPYLKRAGLNFKMKNYNAALKDCDRLISICLKQPTGDSNASRDHINYRLSRAYKFRAKIFKEQKLYGKAISDLEKSLKVASKSSQVNIRFKLVELYMKTGQKEKLRLSLTRLFDLIDTHSKLTRDKIEFRKGCALETFGFKKSAKVALEKAFKLKPDNQIYKTALKPSSDPKNFDKIIKIGYVLFQSELTAVSTDIVLNRKR